MWLQFKSTWRLRIKQHWQNGEKARTKKWFWKWAIFDRKHITHIPKSGDEGKVFILSFKFTIGWRGGGGVEKVLRIAFIRLNAVGREISENALWYLMKKASTHKSTSTLKPEVCRSKKYLIQFINPKLLMSPRHFLHQSEYVKFSWKHFSLQRCELRHEQKKSFCLIIISQTRAKKTWSRRGMMLSLFVKLA